MKKLLALALLLMPSLACAQYPYPSAGSPPTVQLQCLDTLTLCSPIITTNPSWYAVVSTANAAAGTAVSANVAVGGSLIAKASAGNLYGVNVVTGANAGFILIINSATVPGDGAVTPRRCIPIAANTGLEINWRPVPLVFATGIVVVFSTTGCFTKTLDATAFISADAK